MSIGDNVSSVINWLFDKTVALYKKVLIALLILGILFLINGMLGISTFSFTNKKVETLKNIQSILKDTTLDPEVRHNLQEEMIEVSNSRSLQQGVYDIFSHDRKAKKYYLVVSDSTKYRNKILRNDSLFRFKRSTLLNKKLDSLIGSNTSSIEELSKYKIYHKDKPNYIVLIISFIAMTVVLQLVMEFITKYIVLKTRTVSMPVKTIVIIASLCILISLIIIFIFF